ncbi:hypothetical protein KSS87_015344 [Heliosperma pusillum]|nr:hypothetical protein KSS87_015344 [Heliosperma pusillum]
MAAVWLNFHYKGNEFDYPIYDVDLIQILDLISELGDVAMRQGLLIPDAYDLYYKTKQGEKMYIRSDMELLGMFVNLDGLTTIEVWREDTVYPIKEFEIVAELRRVQSENALSRLREEAEHVESLAINIHVVEKEASGAPRTQTHTSPSHLHIQPTPSPNQTQPSPPPTHAKLSQNCPTADRFINSAPFTQFTRSNLHKTKPISTKKIPKTTARRKGIYTARPNTKKMPIQTETSDNRPKRQCKLLEWVGDHFEADNSGSEDRMDADYNEESETSESEKEELDEHIYEEGTEMAKKLVISTNVHPFDTTIAEVQDQSEHYLDKAYYNGTMYLPQEWGSITLRPWLMFISKSEFQLVLADYCIQEGFSLVVLKSDIMRYSAECSGDRCTWKIHVSRLPDKMTWAIKAISGFHKDCYPLKKNPMATSHWMCKKLETELRAQPKMPVKSMADMLMYNYGIQVCLRTMYKVRDMACEQIYGGHEKSYNMLAAYAEMIKKTNPGFWALITWHSPTNDGAIYFKGMFVSFNAWIEGFLKGCRPIIGVDGCHLKGRYKGMLLSAMSLDGNNNLYCIAYAIVGKEKTETWAYFFRNLKLAFEQHGCKKWDWTFISDRMKGVEKALEQEFPRAKRRICAQHLYSNFRDKWGGPLYHDLFWTAANAKSDYVYNKALERMAQMSTASVQYLQNVQQEWSIHTFDPEVACIHNTSNFVESFNALINNLRELPVMSLLEGIRTYYMAKFAERIEVAESLELTGPTPYAKDVLEANCSDSRFCRVIKAGGGEFEVCEGSMTFPVDIRKGACLCGEWQLSGIPCKHACRAIYHNKEEPVHYIHAFFLGQCYKLTYAEHMHPMPDNEQWPCFDFPEVLPPVQERGVGRPTRQRKRKANDPKKRKGKRSTTITCSICKNLGHNARSCQGGLTTKQKKTIATNDHQKNISDPPAPL